MTPKVTALNISLHVHIVARHYEHLTIYQFIHKKGF